MLTAAAPGATCRGRATKLSITAILLCGIHACDLIMETLAICMQKSTGGLPDDRPGFLAVDLRRGPPRLAAPLAGAPLGCAAVPGLLPPPGTLPLRSRFKSAVLRRTGSDRKPR